MYRFEHSGGLLDGIDILLRRPVALPVLHAERVRVPGRVELGLLPRSPDGAAVARLAHARASQRHVVAGGAVPRADEEGGGREGRGADPVVHALAVERRLLLLDLDEEDGWGSMFKMVTVRRTLILASRTSWPMLAFLVFS